LTRGEAWMWRHLWGMTDVEGEARRGRPDSEPWLVGGGGGGGGGSGPEEIAQGRRRPSGGAGHHGRAATQGAPMVSATGYHGRGGRSGAPVASAVGLGGTMQSRWRACGFVLWTRPVEVHGIVDGGRRQIG
jgi:hypothetical protein